MRYNNTCTYTCTYTHTYDLGTYLHRMGNSGAVHGMQQMALITVYSAVLSSCIHSPEQPLFERCDIARLRCQRWRCDCADTLYVQYNTAVQVYPIGPWTGSGRK